MTYVPFCPCIVTQHKQTHKDTNTDTSMAALVSFRSPSVPSVLLFNSIQRKHATFSSVASNSSSTTTNLSVGQLVFGSTTQSSASTRWTNLVRRAVGDGGTSGSAHGSSSGGTASTNNITTAAAAAADAVVYQGVYGPWTIDPSDIREVILYRSGLVTAALTFIIAASANFLPETISCVIKQNYDLLYATGTGGLGLSLLLIHIYVTPIKRFLQVMWAAGTIGSLYTYLSYALPLDESLANYVYNHPISIWFVGPLFASLTGLVFKEGLCYGKMEAGALTFIIPALLLGHLSGLMDDGVEHGLLGLWMALFAIFAMRKFTQPIKDDIGDKSVFMFNALPEDEKEAVLQRISHQVDCTDK